MAELTHRVLWKNGIRYGSEWIRLNGGNKFANSNLFIKYNQDGTAEIIGNLNFVKAYLSVGDVMFYLPKNHNWSLTDYHGVGGHYFLGDKFSYYSLTGTSGDYFILEVKNGNEVTIKEIYFPSSASTRAQVLPISNEVQYTDRTYGGGDYINNDTFGTRTLSYY